ncbi:PGL/p-HBAD biosynthesis glycosyltransferase [Rosistilla oblonga]|uniref:TIGR04283 family arsenosugar biosynthesis glycosyltransferase n=1 Tax=Rosistilla oblonga TaxID=2527990 RepID=UPI00118A2FB5|nr:TIGR04283 family arsenosugar biosynthesis glycosyltransferase [Rosistilla oblonga]QDV13179.1 PGL/p-HBAD biosynthesis glycosyltransferase [Rosistilla oblonga]
MTPAEISVVIPALNEAENIDRCVRSVAAAGEVIVVDGGSDDATAEIAAAAGAKVIVSSSGRATQQNAGAKVASGAVLMFLHADNHLAADAIEQVCNALTEQPERWGGAMEQRIESAGIAFRLLEWGNACRVRLRGLPFGDQAIFVRRDAFQRVGGFPDEPIMEDLILSQRLRQIARPLILPGPVFVDPRRWQQRGIVRQTFRNFALQIAFALGVSPRRLRQYYANHQGS